MNTLNQNHGSYRRWGGRRLACTCLLGMALTMGSFQALADDSQPTRYHVWIQNPWTGDTLLTQFPEPDTSLWNGARIDDYEESLKLSGAPPLGILTIEKFNLEVPIFNGTDEFNLNRGVGRIKGMARIGEDGNLGLSGHRDGFFRVFKDIQLGDEISIQTPVGVETYAVTDLNIIPKTDVSVLAPTTEKKLTIVTCYPFYFVGNAPKRLIVTAEPK